MDFSAPIQNKKGLKPVPRQPFPILDVEAAKKRFAPYILRIDEILKEARDLQVETDEGNQRAVELGTSAKRLTKEIEEVRGQETSKPYNFVKSVNGFCKIFTDKLVTIEGLMKQKISQYRAFQEQKRREAELAAQKATEDLQKKLNAQAKETGTTPVQVEMPIIPKKETVTRSETGSAYGTKHWTYKIIELHHVRQLIADLNIQWKKTPVDVPMMTETILKLKALAPYLVLSDIELRNAVKGGIRQIPGIEIFEEDRTSFRT